VGFDHTGEIEEARILENSISFSSNPQCLKDAAVIIIAVPTPIDAHLRPDLGPVEAASRTVGQNLSRGAVVVYESTVYPGVTEDICVPILEAESGLSLGSDFSVGYSPERINPGDKVHTVETIIKVVAASNPQGPGAFGGPIWHTG
jgi:UDP-N-acetyl-D-mannosaminuronate dehydrogenase